MGQPVGGLGVEAGPPCAGPPGFSKVFRSLWRRPPNLGAIGHPCHTCPCVQSLCWSTPGTGPSQRGSLGQGWTGDPARSEQLPADGAKPAGGGARPRGAWRLWPSGPGRLGGQYGWSFCRGGSGILPGMRQPPQASRVPTSWAPPGLGLPRVTACFPMSLLEDPLPRGHRWGQEAVSPGAVALPFIHH